MVSDFLEDFIKRVFEEMLSNNKNTLSPKQPINSQTYSQSNNFSNNTVPPSQSAAYNPSNSQPAPPPQPATNFYSSSTPNTNGYNQSLQLDERPETFELPRVAKIIGHKDPLVNDLPNLQIYEDGSGRHKEIGTGYN